MADYLVQGSKRLKCGKCGCVNTVSFQTTIYKCPKCNTIRCYRFYGIVVDMHGSYAPYNVPL